MSSISSTHPDLIPSYEPQRLEALRYYQVLGVPGEELSHTLVAMVARLFNVPVALLTLVDAEEVQLVGNVGLEGLTSVPRTDILCSVAILQDGITLYEDLLQRPCHMVNPVATQSSSLHFYAACPLRTSTGYAIGTLCVMDHQPRLFSTTERTLLDSRGELAMSLLDVRAAQVLDPALMPSLSELLNGRIGQSLDRIGTLADLKLWEVPDSEEALAYHQSSLEEATHITHLIHDELQATLQRLDR